MKFLKQFFGASKTADSKEPVETAEEDCQFASDAEGCLLVQQLKQKQAEKRELDARIKFFEEARLDNVTHFMIFLIEMEKHGFAMGRDYSRSHDHSSIYHFFHHREGAARLEDLLRGTTDNELNIIFEELRNLRNKAETISELRSKSYQLSDEIAELKTRLGIE